MLRLVRYSLFALILAGLIQGILYAWPMLTGKDGPLATLTEPFATLISSTQHNQDLARQTDLLVRRNMLKAEVIQLLVAEKISFEEAVDQFQEATWQTRLGEGSEVATQMERATREQHAANLLTWLTHEVKVRHVHKRILRKYQAEFGKHYPSQPSI